MRDVASQKAILINKSIYTVVKISVKTKSWTLPKKPVKTIKIIKPNEF